MALTWHGMAQTWQVMALTDMAFDMAIGRDIAQHGTDMQLTWHPHGIDRAPTWIDGTTIAMAWHWH